MSNKGVTLKDVPSDAFIKAYAEHLKQSKKIDLPQWLDLVKTGCAKELSPYDKDWYFIRAGVFHSYEYYKRLESNFLNSFYGQKDLLKGRNWNRWIP